MREFGVIERVVRAMNMYNGDVAVQSACCRALANCMRRYNSNVRTQWSGSQALVFLDSDNDLSKEAVLKALKSGHGLQGQWGETPTKGVPEVVIDLWTEKGSHNVKYKYYSCS